MNLERLQVFTGNSNRALAQRIGDRLELPLGDAMVLLVLLSPVVNPWYWLWALAVSVRLGQGWLAVAAATAPLAYLNSTVLAEATVTYFRLPEGPFAVVWPAVAAQLLALGWAWRWRRRLQL